MPERGPLDEPDDLPPPPPEPPTQDRPEPKEPRPFRGIVAVAVLVFAVAAIIGLGFAWLSPPVKPVASPSPSEAPASSRVNPCEHETFDSNGCAARMIQGAAQTYEVSPYTVVQVWCSKWSTPKAQRDITKKWVSQGAYPSEAKAVLNEILDYCRTIQPAEGP